MTRFLEEYFTGPLGPPYSTLEMLLRTVPWDWSVSLAPKLLRTPSLASIRCPPPLLMTGPLLPHSTHLVGVARYPNSQKGKRGEREYSFHQSAKPSTTQGPYPGGEHCLAPPPLIPPSYLPPAGPRRDCLRPVSLPNHSNLEGVPSGHPGEKDTPSRPLVTTTPPGRF